MMKYEEITLQEKKIVGVSTITGNNEPDMQKKIGDLWGQYYGAGIVNNIQNKKNAFAIGLYSDYTEDKYCVTVGCEVTENGNTELTYKTIPAGKYAKFTVQGDMVQAVAEGWAEIWKMDLKRTFTGDFEEYVSFDGKDVVVNLYIAIV